MIDEEIQLYNYNYIISTTVLIFNNDNMNRRGTKGINLINQLFKLLHNYAVI